MTSWLGPVLLVCGIICGIIARSKNLNPWPYAIGGAFFPPAGFIMVLRAKPEKW